MKSGLKCFPPSRIWKTDAIVRRSLTHAGASYQNLTKSLLTTSISSLEAGTGQDEKTMVKGHPHGIMVKTPWTTWILATLDVVLRKIGPPSVHLWIQGTRPRWAQWLRCLDGQERPCPRSSLLTALSRDPTRSSSVLRSSSPNLLYRQGDGAPVPGRV